MIFNNRNHVCDFKAGSFKIALITKAPIIPVALIDSYRVFNSFWLGSDYNTGTLFKTYFIRGIWLFKDTGDSKISQRPDQ